MPESQLPESQRILQWKIDLPCIMLIRHAEKPDDGQAGVSPQGLADAQSLSIEGRQRAGALVAFFAPTAGRGTVPHIERPAHLVAAHPVREHPSTRSRETLLPLAAALALEIEERWSTDDPLPQVADYLRALHGPVLVCWRHDSLPALAVHLLQRDEAPSTWPKARFDVVWIVRSSGIRWNLQQVPQRLMANDRVQGIARRFGARSGGARRQLFIPHPPRATSSPLCALSHRQPNAMSNKVVSGAALGQSAPSAPP